MSSGLAVATSRAALQSARQQQRLVGGPRTLLAHPASPFSVARRTRVATPVAAAPRQQDGRPAPADSERTQAAAAAQPRVDASEQQQQQQQQQQHGERWMPASWLSGWKGAGTMLLSFGAVTGGGLMGSGFDITGPFSTLQALGVLGLTVGIHELGHFLAAVTRGIHVTKFSIGFGPTLLKWQGKEVEYSLRALPLGGFVAFPDDDPDSPFEPDDPNLLRNRGLGDRTAVISAGVAANMALALAICLLQASTVGIAEPVYGPGVKLGDIKESTIAGRAGLRRGDIVLRVGDLEVAPQPGSVGKVVNMIKDNPGRELVMLVERQGTFLEIPVTPAPSGADGGGRIGISLAANAEIVRKKADGPVQALTFAGEEFVTLTSTVCKGLYQFITNFSGTVENVSGPVAIIAAGAEVARSGGGGLYQFAALVNINLAVVNILPLPALDGSALLLEFVQGATGQRLEKDVQELIAAFSQAFLVLLGIWIFTHDLEWLGAVLVNTAAQPPPPTQPLP